VVGASRKLDLGDLGFSPKQAKAVLWRIGEADRLTRGFKLSDQPRQYGLETQVPATLTYRIGKSSPFKDWYYCQVKPGDWNIEFSNSETHSRQATLTIAIAGQTNDPKLEVLLNGEPLGNITTAGNSSSQYRSAILSSSYYEVKEIRFPAEWIKAGVNTLTLRLSKGAIHYDTVSLSL
jgi:rhamnogalacturonan endolyase